MFAVSLGLGVFLIVEHNLAEAQPRAPIAAAPKQLAERDKLVKQIDELRRAGKFGEAVPVAERALKLEQQTVDENRSRVAEAISRLAELHELRGDWTGAIAPRKEVVAFRERVDGKDHWRTADARLALALAEKIAGLREPDRTRVTVALRNEQEAGRLNEHGNCAEAERAALEALGTYRAVVGPESPQVGRVWRVIGAARVRRNDANGAKQAIEQAVAIDCKALPKDHPEIAAGLYDLGNLQYELREYAAAKASLEKAVAIRRKALPNGHPDIAQTLNRLGILQFEVSEYAAARASLEEALAIRRSALPKNHPEIALSLNNLGKLETELGEHAAAKAGFEEALAIRRNVLPKDHPLIASTLHNLGVVEFRMRDFAAARACHEEALAIERKVLPKNAPAIAQSLNGLGQVEHALREYATAKASHAEAVAIERTALPRYHPDIARSLSSLGHLQYHLREYAAAKASLEEALAIRRKALPKNHPDIAYSLNNLGLLQRDLGDYSAAKASLEEALAIRRNVLPKHHPGIAQSLQYLGCVNYDLHDFAAAKASLQEALAIERKTLPKDDSAIAYSLLNLGGLCLASAVDAAAALAALAEATDLFQAEQVHLACAQAEPEQLTTAGESHLSLCLLLTAALTSKANPRPIYDRVLRGKGSVTAQQRWVRHARDAADPDTARLLDQLRQLTKQIVSVSVREASSDWSSGAQGVTASLRKLCDERTRLEQELSARNAAFRTILGRARVDSDKVRAVLPKGTALVDLVDYHGRTPPGDAQESIDEHGIAAFVLRPEQSGPVLVSLWPTQALADLIDRWRRSYAAAPPPAAAGANPGVELRKRLWEPLEPYLRGAKVVLVSPDGPLNGLPWAALPGAKPGTFLIHEYAFAVVPVPQLLPEILRHESRPPAEKPSLLLAGGIDFGTEKTRDAKAGAGKLPAVPFFGPLPGAESEVNDLRSQFEDAFPDSPAPQRLIKDRATKEAILAAVPAHRFVHLATHGFFADESEHSAIDVAQRADLLRGRVHLRPEATGRHPGLLSGLVFAGVNRPDRPAEQTVLTALEAADLNLDKVELVTLSACDTGRGRVAGGEGVLGLQRAFQLAGARSVLASLWKVPDEETHQLMREFYRRVWSKNPMSKADALRQAQIWMLENWKPRGTLERPAPQGSPSPYYWAAFVLSGDWR
jgi:CHAT domain-containing protein/Tfp pilus assembly protein PilF